MSTDTTLERLSHELVSGPADAAWQARYGTKLPESLPEWNDTLETLLSHRSVRAYSARLRDALATLGFELR